MSTRTGDAAAGTVAELLDPILDALEAPAPSPTGGSAAAAAAAMAAALLVMVARASGGGDADAAVLARSLRARLVELGDADVSAYAAVLAASREPRGEPTPGPRALAEALLAAAEPPAAIAERAAEVCELSADVRARARPALRGDAVLAVLLAAAAVEGAARLVEIDLAGSPGAREPGHAQDPRAEALRERCRAARARVRRALAETEGEPR